MLKSANADGILNYIHINSMPARLTNVHPQFIDCYMNPARVANEKPHTLKEQHCSHCKSERSGCSSAHVATCSQTRIKFETYKPGPCELSWAVLIFAPGVRRALSEPAHLPPPLAAPLHPAKWPEKSTWLTPRNLRYLKYIKQNIK